MTYEVYLADDFRNKFVIGAFSRFRKRIISGKDQRSSLETIVSHTPNRLIVFDHSRRRVGAAVKLTLSHGQIVVETMVVDHYADRTACFPTEPNFVDEVVALLSHCIHIARMNGCSRVTASAAHTPKLDQAFTTVGFALRPNGVEDGEWLYRLGADELLAA